MLPDSRPQELGVVANSLVGIVELVLLHLLPDPISCSKSGQMARHSLMLVTCHMPTLTFVFSQAELPDHL